MLFIVLTSPLKYVYKLEILVPYLIHLEEFSYLVRAENYLSERVKNTPAIWGLWRKPQIQPRKIKWTQWNIEIEDLQQWTLLRMVHCEWQRIQQNYLEL